MIYIILINLTKLSHSIHTRLPHTNMMDFSKYLSRTRIKLAIKFSKHVSCFLVVSYTIQMKRMTDSTPSFRFRTLSVFCVLIHLRIILAHRGMIFEIQLSTYTQKTNNNHKHNLQLLPVTTIDFRSKVLCNNIETFVCVYVYADHLHYQSDPFCYSIVYFVWQTID